MGTLAHYIIEILRFSWQWVYLFSPIKLIIVRQGELGFRRTLGKPGKNLDVNGRFRGLYFATTGQTLDATYALNRKAEIGPVSVPLKECIPIEAWAVLVFDIEDVAAWASNCSDPSWLIGELQEAELREALMRHTYEELAANMYGVEQEAMRQAQQRIDDLQLGVRIKSLRLKLLQIQDSTAQNALMLPRLASAMQAIPEQLADHKNFASMVGLLVGAKPVVTMSSYSGYAVNDSQQDIAKAK